MATRMLFILFGSIFSIFGLLVLSKILSDVYRFIRYKKFPVVSGTIQSSKVEKHTYYGDNVNSVVYHPAIFYRYEVNGIEYVNDDRDLSNSTVDNKKSEQLVAEYPIGMKVNVFYNPKEPKESTLKTRYNKISIVLNLKTIIPLAVGALFFGLAFTIA